MGLGLSGGAWWRTVPVLAGRLRVITFDARGIGRSPSTRHNYTVEAMADDAAAVLDGVGLDAAHVYGISLGGMVAQNLVLRHPEPRARAGPRRDARRRPARDPARRDVLAFFSRRASMAMEEAAWASVPYNYGPRCREEQVDRIAEDIERRLENPFKPAAYRAQLYAAGLHNTYGRLPRIRVPTLVVHGQHDRVIPVENARMMAERIPGCRLQVLLESGTSTRPRSPRSTRTSPRSSRLRLSGPRPD